jgi:MFS family permease
VTGTTIFTVFGGLLVAFFVGDGPYRKKSAAPDFKKFFTIFSNPAVRKPAIGYFGHMWELYTFWAFVPLAILYFYKHHPVENETVSFWAFIVIGAGGLGCITSGYLAQRIGSHKTATYELILSGVCCILSPFVFSFSSALFLLFLIFWGIVVVADSPQFSTLVAMGAPKESVGTALTIMNSIGFAITIISIQLITLLVSEIDFRYIFLLLAPGPIIGVWAMQSK